MQDYANSNELLYKVLNNSIGAEGDASIGFEAEVTTDIMLKTLKMMARNFMHNQNYKETIRYLLKAIKLINDVQDKVELY